MTDVQIQKELRLYAVYDTELEKDYMPFFALNNQEAERSFMLQLMNVPDVIRDKMILNYLGSFNERFEWFGYRDTVSYGEKFAQWLDEHTRVAEKKESK